MSYNWSNGDSTENLPRKREEGFVKLKKTTQIISPGFYKILMYLDIGTKVKKDCIKTSCSNEKKDSINPIQADLWFSSHFKHV